MYYMYFVPFLGNFCRCFAKAAACVSAYCVHVTNKSKNKDIGLITNAFSFVVRAPQARVFDNRFGSAIYLPLRACALALHSPRGELPLLAPKQWSRG